MPKILSSKFEMYRKIVHIFSMFIPILYIFIDKIIIIILLFILLIFMLLIEFFRRKKNIFTKIFRKFLNPIIRPYEDNNLMSATHLVIIALIIIILIPSKYKYIPILAITYSSFCDACAAIYGMNFGYIKLINDKTLEGTAIFMASGLFITFLFTFLDVVSFNDINMIYLILCPLLAGLVELFTITKYDNITVPLFSAVFLYISIII